MNAIVFKRDRYLQWLDARRFRIVQTIRSDNFSAILLILLLVLAWFASLELRGLFIPDEGRYAEIPREMLATGDWITPRLNALKYFEKPPLQYWLTAISFSLFGEDEWTARLPSALLGFGAILMVWFTASRLWSKRAGLLAAMILGSNWGFYLSAQYLTLDMTLSALLAFALCAFLLAQQEGWNNQVSRNWMLIAWGSAALAILSKGLVGALLPALALSSYSIFTKNWGTWRRLHAMKGATLLAAIALPWFVLVQKNNPEFFQFFFIHEHFQRFATDGHSRVGPWWYYFPILLIGLIPWTGAVAYSMLHRPEEAEESKQFARFDTEFFCLIWALSIIVFFSVSHSKLPAYIFPAFPAIALWLGKRLQGMPSAAFKWCAWSLAGVGIALLIGLTALHRSPKFIALGPDAITALPLLYGAALLLIFCGLIAAWQANQKQTGRSIALLVLGSFAFWGLVFGYLHRIDAGLSSERLIDKFNSEIRYHNAGVPFFSVGQFDHSVPFYLRRPVTLVNFQGELRPGIEAEPSKAINSIDQFENIWNALDRQAFAIMTPESFIKFSGRIPMVEVERDRRLVIVSRYR